MSFHRRLSHSGSLQPPPQPQNNAFQKQKTRILLKLHQSKYIHGGIALQIRGIQKNKQTSCGLDSRRKAEFALWCRKSPKRSNASIQIGKASLTFNDISDGGISASLGLKNHLKPFVTFLEHEESKSHQEEMWHHVELILWHCVLSCKSSEWKKKKRCPRLIRFRKRHRSNPVLKSWKPIE